MRSSRDCFLRAASQGQKRKSQLENLDDAYIILLPMFANKVKMEQITVVMRNCESAFWKKGMFSDGELRSSVRILQGPENLGFRCCATPIIMTSMPKLQRTELTWNKLFYSWKLRIGILKENNVFRRVSSEVLTAVLWESRAWKLCTCQLFIQSTLSAIQASICWLDAMMDIRVSG